MLGWLALGAAAAAVLAGCSLRVIPEHQRAVVSRLGRTVRVIGPGLVATVPVLERLTTVPLGPAHRDLIVTAATLDGATVKLRGTAVCRVTDPSRWAAARPDPLAAAVDELETRLACEVAHRTLAALLPALKQMEAKLPSETTAVTAEWGVRVVQVGVMDIETRLTPALLRCLQAQPGGR